MPLIALFARRQKAWHERIAARPGVQRGRVVGEYLRDPNYRIGKDPVAAKILFGQRAHLAQFLISVNGISVAALTSL